MRIKAVFLDVDGTLLSEKDRSLSQRTEESIRRLIEKGIHIILVTGRPHQYCEEFMQLGIDTIISANGALITCGGERIYKSVLSSPMIREFSHFAISQGHALSYFTESFAMNGVCRTDSRVTDALRETLGLIEYPDQMVTLDNEMYCMCLYANEEETNKYQAQFPSLRFVRFHPYVCNVLEVSEVSKYVAAQAVITYINVCREETMAFGDGENDIDLLTYAGVGVAMGNGGAVVKQCADYVTLKASDDGVTHALKHFKVI
ncbi:5-amino-6-(5-phospho-D-ribitylamino)uracil phosphatase YitU [Paenibacillus sp. JJ-100]|uniref:Cof-type HAD-IIB family hydrolase n=1 Tax=Paenibacillus sp. JJ-100 TaxID=2974896 RepID=UPI0022FFB5D9|nr:Cof-type HAD-IIB family hydrolase [Paenibacillus sp. JJ-100]CAI6015797.1 5-amino-6-(5-phospho-D-ribitylamino)uracil phosphatase YitU [Paenibacillus sp. JJ-100]